MQTGPCPDCGQEVIKEWDPFEKRMRYIHREPCRPKKRALKLSRRHAEHDRVCTCVHKASQHLDRMWGRRGQCLYSTGKDACLCPKFQAQDSNGAIAEAPGMA